LYGKDSKINLEVKSIIVKFVNKLIIKKRVMKTAEFFQNLGDWLIMLILSAIVVYGLIKMLG